MTIKLVIDAVLLILGGVFFAALFIGYKDYKKNEDINRLNKSYYGEAYEREER